MRQQDGNRQRPATPLILVVENENGGVWKLLLHLGFEAHRATDGLAALDAYDHERFDMVLIDRDELPALDGDAVLEGIRVRELGRPRALIVGLGSTSANQTDRTDREQFYELVAKPTTSEELSELLAEWSQKLETERRDEEGDVAILDRSLFELTRDSLLQFDALDEGLEDLLNPAWIGHFAGECRPSELKRLSESAHKLKGTAVQFGAFRMSRLCAEIEARAKAEEGFDPRQYLTALKAEIERVSLRIQSLSESD